MISTQAPPRTESEALFADVIVPRHLAGPFTYIVPLSLRPTLRIGHRVLVPFGRAMLQGAVVTLSPTLPYGLSLTRLKEIDSLLPEGTATDVSPDLFQLSRQVVRQYVAPWGQCLRLVLPPTAKPQKPISHYQLTEQGKAAVAAREPCSVKERALLVKLHKAPSGLRKSYRRSGLADLLQDLTAREWVREVHGSPSASTTPSAQPSSQLSLTHPDHAAPLCSDQAPLWAEPLFETLNNPGPSRVLVQAPWADRLKLLQQTIRLILDRGQTILILVGEAERAQWVADLIRDDKRNIAPACFHSGLLDQAKAELWDQIHRQVVRVIVGTRSAIFLPLTAIGAMWVEGEEDAAFKEAQEPRYHARDVAWLRAQTERTVLILSSSHPFLETRANVEQGGVLIYKSIPSDTRPAVQVVDLRKQGYGTVLSQPLIRAIQQTISRKAGVLLFLNRKGYAGALVCRDCVGAPLSRLPRSTDVFSTDRSPALFLLRGEIVHPGHLSFLLRPPHPIDWRGHRKGRRGCQAIVSPRSRDPARWRYHEKAGRGQGPLAKNRPRGMEYHRRHTTALAARTASDHGPCRNCASRRRTQRAGFSISRTHLSHLARCRSTRRSGRSRRPGHPANLSSLAPCDSGRSAR